MPLSNKIRSFFRNVFSTRKVEANLEDEIQEHIEMLAEEKVRSGMERTEARRTALVEVGGKEQVKEQVREARIGYWVQSFFADCKYGLRQIRKSPSFSIVAVFTLALAICANAVVFSVMDAMILRPLNVPRAESFYSIHRVSDNSSRQSYRGYLDLRDRNSTFEDIAAYTILLAGVDTGQDTSRTWLLAVSGNYFDVLGLQPYLGRFFHASDEHGANSAPFVVVSHSCWRTRFHEDRTIVGRTILLNKHPFTVAGVAPPDFRGTLLIMNPDFFIPIVNQEQIEGINILNARNNRWIFMTMGHLKKGITIERAVSDLNSVAVYLEKTYPKDHAPTKYKLSRPSLYGDFLGGPLRAFLTALMVLAALILLAACANLGSLFAARAADRTREIAMRLALGAGRMRILRQLLTESLLISCMGGIVGLWASVMILRAISVWQPFPQFPMYFPIHPDLTVYITALLLAMVSGILFGAAAVRQVLRTDPYEIVKSGTRSTSERRITGRDVLVIVQIAICAVLVTSSIVAVRGLVRSLHSNFGFDAKNVMLVNTTLEMAGYHGDVVPHMQKRMVESMKTIPGVSSVGMVDWPPLSNGSGTATIIYKDETVDLKPGNAAATPMILKSSPDYFSAARTTLLTGRIFTLQDDQNSPKVAVVNQEFARRLFGRPELAVGHYFKMKDGTRVQVIGIVENGKYASLSEDPEAAMFLPLLQSPSSDTWMVIRSNSDSQQIASAIKNKMRGLDPGLPCFIQTWDEGMNLALFPARMATISLGILGLMGAMLSVSGIFGMAAYSVSKRMRELGIRMALGAQRKQVLHAALGRALKLLTYGSITGLLLGILAARVLASIVYQATPRDPVVLTFAIIGMSLLGLIATWVPAQRALSVQPLILLREE